MVICLLLASKQQNPAYRQPSTKITPYLRSYFSDVLRGLVVALTTAEKAWGWLSTKNPLYGLTGQAASLFTFSSCIYYYFESLGMINCQLC